MNRSNDWLSDLMNESGDWSLPPDSVRGHLRRLPEGAPAPVLAEQKFSDRPVDVRGASDTVDGTGGVIVAAAGDGGELSVAVTVHHDEVELEAQVWLDEDADVPIFAYLRHDDHVLQEARAQDGEVFTLREPAPAGWVLDVVLPSGECLRVKDPR